MMNGSSKRCDVIAEEAAEWVIVLADADDKTRNEFVAWLRLSPEHIKEFLSVSSIWGTLPELTSQPLVEELVQLAEEQPNVVAMPRAFRRGTAQTLKSPSSGRRLLWRVAATVLFAVAAGVVWMLVSPLEKGKLYVTLTGEQSSVPLADGSLVTLNTRSSLRVAYSDGFRDIHLIEGEALFKVTEDVARPFRVTTEQAIIEAMGTQFNVHKDDDEVTVTVIEGSVNVSATAPSGDFKVPSEGPAAGNDSPQAVRLEVGQQARVGSDSSRAVVSVISVEKATAWRQHLLMFDDLPLKHVIEEFNRYNDPPVIIEDKELQSLPISGVFRSDDRSSFLQFLSQMQLSESAIRSDGTIVLKAKPEK